MTLPDVDDNSLLTVVPTAAAEAGQRVASRSRCLAACYWASLDRVVFAATTYDVAACGLKDLAVYNALRLPAGRRSLTEVAEGDDLRQSAAAVLRDWAGRWGR
jgi:hypothetical protein